MSTELSKLFGPDVVAAMEERMREIAREERAASEARPSAEEVLTPKQLAAMKGVSRRTVYGWVEERRIPYHRTPGGQLRFYRRDAEKVVT